MNKRQKLQVALAVFFIVYILFLFLSPGWKAGKILGIIGGVCMIIALYVSYRAEEKNKHNTDH